MCMRFGAIAWKEDFRLSDKYKKIRKIETWAGKAWDGAKCARMLVLLMLLVVLLSMVGCGEEAATKGEEEPAPCTDMADLASWYGVTDTTAKIFTNGVPEERYALIKDGVFYVPTSIMKKWDGRFYWNEQEEQLIVTDALNIYTFWPDQMHHKVNEDYVEDTACMIISQDGGYYINLDMAAQFGDYQAKTYTSPNRVIAFTNGAELTAVQVEGSVTLRIGSSDQKEIVAQGLSGTFYACGDLADNWKLVTTEDGMYGYLSAKECTSITEVSVETASIYRPKEETDSTKYSHILIQDEVVMVWHQVFAKQGGAELETALSGTSGVNVISPTWYSITSVEGEISDYSDASYVQKAHEKGIQVWALVNDFAKGVPGYDVLSNTDTRTKVIYLLTESLVAAGADGINVDFEYITAESAPHYLQFLRELSIACRKKGLVLSVDHYNPVYGETFYEISTQSDFVDYVVIMAYDEHTAGSSEAGSVASLPYVKSGIEQCRKMISADRIIVGIPFYTRRWTTETNGEEVSISTEALGMDTAKQYAADKGAEWTWNEELGQYYTSYDENGAKGEIWLEDVDSLKKKLALAKENGVAGVAAWKLGLESAEVWELFK